jgi:flavin-dependent dehydrogenase
LVGESLLPAVIPLLRELGVEDEVRAYGVHKPGATFVLPDGTVIGFHFADSAGRLPGYAYNVPRDRFDATLLAACVRQGARVFAGRARLERDPAEADRIRLVAPTDEVADYFDGEPDWIVDASGRSRVVGRLRDLPARAGARRDVALFAHCEGVRVDHAGHVHMDHLRHGWCWRIPLPSAVSLGIVAPRGALTGLGDDAAAQYDGCIAVEPHLRDVAGAARRVSHVQSYTNYQMRFERAVGDGWALVGDALGFVDPIFSSGLYLAMDGARALADTLCDASDSALRNYETRQKREIGAWQRTVDYYYDGSLFELVRQSRAVRSGRLAGRFHRHVSTSVSRILTGESTTGFYSPRLLAFLIRHGVDPANRSALAIR